MAPLARRAGLGSLARSCRRGSRAVRSCLSRRAGSGGRSRAPRASSSARAQLTRCAGGAACHARRLRRARPRVRAGPPALHRLPSWRRRATASTCSRCGDDGADAHQAETCDADKGIACRAGRLQEPLRRRRARALERGLRVLGGRSRQRRDVAAATRPRSSTRSSCRTRSPTSSRRSWSRRTTPRPGAQQRCARSEGRASAPRSLEVFKLGPQRGRRLGARHVQHRHAHCALARRVPRALDVPIVAYQFNPLENVNVFSNDASLLLPTRCARRRRRALVRGRGMAADHRDQRRTRRRTSAPNLRAFLTIVGTRPDTQVTSQSRRASSAAGHPGRRRAGRRTFDVTLEPFDVLNLETGDFNADFTGTASTRRPRRGLLGSEASDAPLFSTLATAAAARITSKSSSSRCARRASTSSLSRVPNRAGARRRRAPRSSPFDEPEFFRVVAAHGRARRRSRPAWPRRRTLTLDGEGANVTLVARPGLHDRSDRSPCSSPRAGEPGGRRHPPRLPGGDPSLMIVAAGRAVAERLRPPHARQVRLRLPRITAPPARRCRRRAAGVGKDCEIAPADGLREGRAASPPVVVYRCQLCFPTIDLSKPPPITCSPGPERRRAPRSPTIRSALSSTASTPSSATRTRAGPSSRTSTRTDEATKMNGLPHSR